MNETPDNRTMADLANEAIQVQNACNLSGVVLSFAKSIVRLRVLMREMGRESTAEINSHPVCVMWADKIQSLTRWDNRGSWSEVTAKAYTDCLELATRG